jgi:hypothetical protein
MGETGFEQVAHLVTVPVTVDGVETTFVVDSGIGFTVVRDGLLPLAAGGEFTGRRMSGQAVTIPLSTVETLSFAGREWRDVPVGVLDMSGFPDALGHVGGFVSLALFEEEPLTVDYPGGVVRVGQPTAGVELAARVERDGPSVAMYVPMALPGGHVAECEVDMGSDVLILDERFAALGCGEERVVDGVDETGHAYTRRFATLAGAVHPVGAPELAQDDPPVMFQSIIYGGLVGRSFLQRFAVTFDVGRGTLVLAG